MPSLIDYTMNAVKLTPEIINIISIIMAISSVIMIIYLIYEFL